MPLLLLALVACDGTAGSSGKGGAVDAPALRLSTAIETVIVAEWTPVEGASRTWIEFGADTGYGAEAPERSDGEALILGMTSGAEVHARLAAEIDGEVVYSDDASISAGTVPSDVAEWSPDEDSGADFGDWFLTSFSTMGGGGGSQGGAIVTLFDRAGEPVWYTPPQSGIILAARPSRDGQAIVYLWGEGPTPTDAGEICRVDLSGEETTCLSTPYATHDFVELPDGSFTYGKGVEGTWEGYDLMGSALANITPDGAETELWSTWDEIEPVPTSLWSSQGRGGAIDWTHLNGIWYDDATSAYYVSFLLIEEVRKISGGATEWVMGGDENGFAVTGTLFGPQHAPQLVDGGLVVFDNAQTGSPSRLVRYALDESAMTATEELEIPHPDGVHAVAMGDANLLANGYWAGAFGDAGDYFVFSPEGDVEYALYPDAGVLAGQIYVYDSLYGLGSG